jgi:glycosyltransferase involved in cell wall biosynthesis
MTGGGPLRVLHVLGGMNPGGVEMRLLELMRRLCPQEFRVDICALSGREGLLDGDVRARGGAVFPLALDAHFPRRFVRLLRRNRYRVVHSHVLYASGVVLALAAYAGVPVRIAHFRATEDGCRPTIARWARRAVLQALIDRCATDIVGCGEGAMDAVWRPGWRDDDRCRIIYNAVDPARFSAPVDRTSTRREIGVPGDARLFIHVGRDDVLKNQRRVTAIFARLRQLDPGAWLVLAGPGTTDPAGETARAIAQLRDPRHIVALGARHDVPRLLKAADALLLPSLSEGLPGIVLEARASGLPVLASDLPGVREIASRLPGVRYLPLSAGDGEWAGAAVALARDHGPETAAHQALRNSVFHVDCAVDAHRRLWNRRVDGETACT